MRMSLPLEPVGTAGDDSAICRRMCILRVVGILESMATSDTLEQSPIAVPLSHPVPSSKAGREPFLDLARLVAAIGIIWIHTPRSKELSPYTALGRFAVPFFVVSAIYLLVGSVRRNPERSFRDYASNRFMRLYVPFLIWTGIYYLLQAAKYRFISGRSVLPLDFYMLWVGTAIQLGFLPFLLIVSLLCFPLARWIVNHPTSGKGVAILAAVVGVAVALVPLLFDLGPAEMTNRWQAMVFVSFAWATLPALCWGLSLAAMPESFLHWMRTRWAGGLNLLITAAMLALVCIKGRISWAENLAGVGWFCAGLVCWGSSQRLLRLCALGAVAFGIYLCHHMFIQIAQIAASRVGLSPTAWLDVVIFLLAAAASVAFSIWVSRYKSMRWLFP